MGIKRELGRADGDLSLSADWANKGKTHNSLWKNELFLIHHTQSNKSPQIKREMLLKKRALKSHGRQDI